MSEKDENNIINVKSSLKSSNTSDDPSLWLDKDEAALFSGRNKETISKWVRKKNLEKNKIQIKYVQGRTGQEVRIYKPSLESYLENIGEEARVDEGSSHGTAKGGTTPRSYSKLDGIKSSQDHSTVVDETMGRYVQSLEEQVAWLRGQLETVNEQRGRDQVLMLNLQNDNKRLLEQKEEVETKLEDEVTGKEEPKKKGWWPFGN